MPTPTSTFHTIPPVALRTAFARAKFGAVPDGIEPTVAAWYWAFYASHGDHDQAARERAIQELRYMSPAALHVVPRTREDGSLSEWPSAADRPFAPANSDDTWS